MITKKFNFTKGTSVVLLALVSLVALAVELWLVYGELNRNVVAYEQLIAVEKQKENAEAMRQAVAELAEANQIIDNHFITPDTVSRVIEDLEQLAKLSDVDFSLTGAEIVEDDTSKVELSFTATGPFANLYRLIALIGHMPYALRFTSTQIGLAGQTTGEWQGQFSFEITSFLTEANQ